MTPTKEELINLIVNDKSFNTAINKVDEQLRDDFQQHFYLQLCEKSHAQLLEVYNRCNTCLQRFAATIFNNQLKSEQSTFHRLYRANSKPPDTHTKGRKTIPYETQLAVNAYYNELVNSVDVIPAHAQQLDDKQLELIEKIHSILRAIHWKKSRLFKEYHFNNLTVDAISKKYKIKYSTCYYTIKQAEKIIRDKLKDTQ